MTDEISRDEGAALWRQALAAAQTGSAVEKVSPLDLAAWLDGRAEERLSARIEAALAVDPVLLETALAAVAPSQIDSPVSDRIAVRARALVAPQIKATGRSGGWLSGLSGWRRRAEWAMVGLSLMVAAAAGLWIGRGVGDSVLSETATVSLFDDDTGFGGLLSSTEDL